MALRIIMGVTQAIGTITPDIRTTIPAIATLTATRTMGGIRGARTLTGIPRPHRILIRRLTLIGYPMSAGAEPSACVFRSIAITDSSGRRSSNPVEGDHGFRSKAITHSSDRD